MSTHDAAVAEPEQTSVPEQAIEDRKRPKRQPRYHVVLWNDDDHTVFYVVVMMKRLFGHPAEKGLQIAKEVDSQGRSVVLTTTQEHAELKRDQIHSFGKDALVDECQGSMSATIEPVAEE